MVDHWCHTIGMCINRHWSPGNCRCFSACQHGWLFGDVGKHRTRAAIGFGRRKIRMVFSQEPVWIFWGFGLTPRRLRGSLRKVTTPTTALYQRAPQPFGYSLHVPCKVWLCGESWWVPSLLIFHHLLQPTSTVPFYTFYGKIQSKCMQKYSSGWIFHCIHEPTICSVFSVVKISDAFRINVVSTLPPSLHTHTT